MRGSSAGPGGGESGAEISAFRGATLLLRCAPPGGYRAGPGSDVPGGDGRGDRRSASGGDEGRGEPREPQEQDAPEDEQGVHLRAVDLAHEENVQAVREQRADGETHRRYEPVLQEEVAQDVAALGAECATGADLPRPFGHRKDR